MQTLGGLVGVLVILGLLIKYWWVVAIIAAIGAVIYFINKSSKAATGNGVRTGRPPAAPPTLRNAAVQPRAPQQAASGLRFVDVPEAHRAPQPARVPGFPLANLSRRQTGYPTKQLVFTAVDLETTGLDRDTDRIVEIGLVKFSADGKVIDEFATLVNNPGSNREARDVHQIADADLVGSPSTAEALREAFAFMAGTVLVAHNFDFEDRFLAAAARREHLPLPPVLGVCSLQTSRRQLDGRAYSLTVMYKTATKAP